MKKNIALKKKFLEIISSLYQMSLISSSEKKMLIQELSDENFKFLKDFVRSRDEELLDIFEIQ